MSIKKDILTTLVAGLVIAVVFALVIWYPHHKRLAVARAELATVSEALDAELANSAALVDLNTQVHEMARQIEQLDTQLVSQTQLSVLLGQFSTQLRQIGIENQTLHTQSPKLYSDYVAVPLTLGFQGQYKQIDTFLRYIEQMNYPVFISYLSMKRNPSSEDKLISVNLRLMVFFAPEGESSS